MKWSSFTFFFKGKVQPSRLRLNVFWFLFKNYRKQSTKVFFLLNPWLKNIQNGHSWGKKFLWPYNLNCSLICSPSLAEVLHTIIFSRPFMLIKTLHILKLSSCLYHKINTHHQKVAYTKIILNMYCKLTIANAKRKGFNSRI